MSELAGRLIASMLRRMAKIPRCAVCKTPIPRPKPGEMGDFPFCSQRCKSVDLGHWLDDGYVIADDPWGDQLMLDPEETAH